MENIGESKLERAIRALKEADEHIAAVAKEAIVDACAPIFEQNPDIDSVGWYQYTPYFNDGDPCVFRSGHRYFDVPPDKPHSKQWYKTSDVPGGNLLASVPDEVMERVFGDHVKITIRRDLTVEVTDYEHD